MKPSSINYCYTILLLVLLFVIRQTESSIPRSSPSHQLRLTGQGDDSSIEPWIPSPLIDENGFLVHEFSCRVGNWEEEADLPGRHGYSCIRRRNKRQMRKIQRKYKNNDDINDACDHDEVDYEICKVQVRQVPGDGNCLFHSLSLCLHHAETSSHLLLRKSDSLRDLYSRSKKLRQLAVGLLQQGSNRDDEDDENDIPMFLQGDEFLSSSELLQAAAAQYNISPEEYCKCMSQDCYWGGGPEIVSLVNVLRRPIHVYELAVRERSVESSFNELSDNEELTDRGRRPLLRGGGSSTIKEFYFSRMACFGSPKYDKREPLHILSADSRFPDINPGRQLSSGNHFMAIFPVNAYKSKVKSSRASEGTIRLDSPFKGETPSRKQKVASGTTKYKGGSSAQKKHNSRKDGEHEALFFKTVSIFASWFEKVMGL